MGIAIEIEGLAAMMAIKKPICDLHQIIQFHNIRRHFMTRSNTNIYTDAL